MRGLREPSGVEPHGLRRAATLLAVVLFHFLASTPTSATAQDADPDDLLLDEIGPGWTTIDCLPEPGAVVNCFATEGGSSYLELRLTAVPPDTDVRARAEQLASLTGGTVIEVTGMEGAFRADIDAGAAELLRQAYVASDGFVTSISLFASGDDVADPDALILDIARRQQLRTGGPPSGGPAPDVPAELLEVLLDAPPAGFTTGAPIAEEENFDSFRHLAKSDEVIDLLNRERIVVSRAFTAPGSAILMHLVLQPYEHLAAVELDGVADSEIATFTDERISSTIEDAVAFQFESGPDGGASGVAFRRDRFVVMVTGISLDPSFAAATNRAVVEVARAQAAELPPGPTSPFSFPSRLGAVTFALITTTIACLACCCWGWIAVLRGPRRSVPLSDSPDVVDVTRAATVLRRSGLLLVAVQIIAVNAVVIGVLYVLDGPGVVSVAGIAGGAVLGLVFTRWSARRELGGAVPDRGPSSSISVAGVVLGGGAAVGIVLGVATAATGLESLAFGPTLTRLERSVQLGISPTTQSIGLAVTGTGLMIIGGALVRVARRRMRTSAAKLRDDDPRRPILYLRSFHDDDLRVATVGSARRPFLELFRLRGRDPFEEALAWQLAPHGPVVAVGRPGVSLASLGAARDHLPEETWRTGVAERMHDARTIVVVIGATAGLAWEVGQIAEHGLLAKTMFVFPPTDPTTLHTRWRFIEDVLSDLGVVTSLPVEAADALTARRQACGRWSVTVAESRDEASYHAAIDVAMHGTQVEQQAQRAEWAPPTGLRAELQTTGGRTK